MSYIKFQTLHKSIVFLDNLPNDEKYTILFYISKSKIGLKNTHPVQPSLCLYYILMNIIKENTCRHCFFYMRHATYFSY